MQVRGAHQQVSLAVSNLRTYLLRVAYGLADVDGWLWQMRLSVEDARKEYTDAAGASTDGLFQATAERMEQEISKAKGGRSRHQKRRDFLQQILSELEGDISDRARALSSEPERSATTTTGVNDWEEAEELAAESLRGLGYTDARRAPPGSDGGVDVEGRGIVAQVKYRATPVGRPDVQTLVGANQHGARSVFYARAGYTQGATQYADQVGVALFKLDVSTRSVQPANTLAEELVSS